jgi:uncharacterized protein (TIGR02646 family)
MFKEPNFTCRVTKVADPPGAKPFSRLLYAESEAAAREMLDRMGYVVQSLDAYDFKIWKDEAKQKYEEAAKSFANKDFTFANIWGDLKEHLQDLYRHRCAYCDGAYEAFGYGDVEHYRPKGRVTEEPGHPGYWWLAYDPNNYLPSCQRCNQEAKKNHFPVGGKRAKAPADSLDDEMPLLMHPDRDEWFDHVRFMPTCSSNGDKPGWAKGVSDKGRKSIEVFGLNREPLRDARQREQQLALLEYKQALVSSVNSDDDRSLNDLKQRCETGLRPFYAAAMDEMLAYAAKKGFKPPFSHSNGGGKT